MDDRVERAEKRARHVNVTLAGWLVVSAFGWRHEGPRFVVTSLVAAVVVAVAPSALGAARVQRFNTLAGIALAAAAVALPRAVTAMTWINVIVGLTIAAVSLIPPIEGFHVPHPVRAWRSRHPRRTRRRR